MGPLLEPLDKRVHSTLHKGNNLFLCMEQCVPFELNRNSYETKKEYFVPINEIVHPLLTRKEQV